VRGIDKQHCEGFPFLFFQNGISNKFRKNTVGGGVRERGGSVLSIGEGSSGIVVLDQGEGFAKAEVSKR